MAEKILQTRIALKIDTLANWKTSTLLLKEGEIALATIASSDGVGLSEPVIMAKIGQKNDDGELQTFGQLPWAFHAKSSDVLAACKSEAGLKAFINDVIADAGIATDDALVALAGRVTTAEGDIDALESKVGSKAVATQIEEAIAALKLSDTYEVKGEAAKVQASLDSYKTSNDAAISAIKDGASIDSFKDVEDALSGKQAAGDYATKAEAQGYADAKDDAIAAAKKAGDDAQADVDALSAKVGTVTEGKTVVEMIADAKTAATYNDAEVRGLISDNAAAIQTEKARMDAFMTLDDGETLNSALDSLKEIQDYITNEAADADILVGKVSALEAIVDGIGGEGESATVVAYVQAAIEALKIGDYAKATDLAALAGRVATIEGDYLKAADKSELQGKIDAINNHSHTNKTELDKFVDGDKAKLDDAASKAHEHSNKTVLDGITAAKVTAWDGAEQAAKDYADDKIEALGIGNYVTKAAADAAYDAKGAAAAVQGETTETVASVNTKVGTAQSRADEAYTLASGKATMAEVNSAISNAGHAVAKDLSDHIGNTTVHITAAERTKWNAADTKAHEHSNKSELDLIQTGDVAKWNSAQANAEKTASDALAAARTEITAEIDGDVGVVQAALDSYKSSNDSALAGVKSTADSAVQTITASTGLKATKTGTDVAIDFDDSVTFVFDCGNSVV